MVKMIGVSPTYLSTVELDEFPPPAEDKVKAIAKIIQCDADDLLARAQCPRISRTSSSATRGISGAPADHQRPNGRR
jgi:hypothetical protein